MASPIAADMPVLYMPSCTPQQRSPERAGILSRYMALHSQQHRLRQSIRQHTPSPPLSPTSISPMRASPDMSSSEPSSGSPSPTLDAQSQQFSQISPPAFALPKPATAPRKSFSRSPSNNIAPIPEEDSLEEFELRGSNEENKLFDVNHEIKTTLTDLLNCESVRNDGKMRLWIQTRLMDAEMELKRQRRSSTRRRSSAPRIVLTET